MLSSSCSSIVFGLFGKYQRLIGYRNIRMKCSYVRINNQSVFFYRRKFIHLKFYPIWIEIMAWIPFILAPFENYIRIIIVIIRLHGFSCLKQNRWVLYMSYSWSPLSGDWFFRTILIAYTWNYLSSTQLMNSFRSAMCALKSFLYFSDWKDIIKSTRMMPALSPHIQPEVIIAMKLE